MKKSRKAQLQMAENIGVLIVFFILLVFGLIFYVGIQKASYKSRTDEFSQLQALSTSQKALYMPEFSCTQGFNVPETLCFDKGKMVAFDNFIKKNPTLARTLYYDYFLESTISVQEILPNANSWVLYNNSNLLLSSYATQLPISIYDPSEETFSFGILHVNVFAK